MRRSLTLLILVLLVAMPAVAEDPFEDPGDGDPSAEGAPTSFADRVNEALDHGVRWLLLRPRLYTIKETPIAHWGLVSSPRSYLGDTEVYKYPAGATALALYTLLKCGVEPNHPVIERGFSWLTVEHVLTERDDGYDAKGYRTSYREGWTSYEISAQILALTAKYDQDKRTKTSRERRRRGKLKIKDKADREWLEFMVETLVARRGICGQDDAPEHRRGWRYNGAYKQVWPPTGKQVVHHPEFIPPANQDLSSTQLAALALYSAHLFDVKVPPEVWLDIATFTLDCQEDEGPEHARHDPGMHEDGYVQPTDHARGFCYIKGSPRDTEGIATGAMTACGVANLILAREVLGETTRGKRLWKKQRLSSRVETAVWDGLAWLDHNWSPFHNPPPGRPQYHVYYLYALERAMDLMGKELVGKHLWYHEGAEQLLDRAKHAALGDSDHVESGPGAWWDSGSTHEPCDLLDTCFALLFLRRATKDIAPAVTGR